MELWKVSLGAAIQGDIDDSQMSPDIGYLSENPYLAA
jgi:hypothetical protein